MKKLESTFPNMVLSLTCITLVAAAALGGAYMLTAESIEQQQSAKQTAAISAVLPAHDSIAAPETVENMTVYKAYANGEFVGAAVETSADGFGGVIQLMVGFDADNHIVNYEVLSLQETPGLGSKIPEWFKDDQKPTQNIIGREANGQFTVSKDGGDVDAITAATISSRAFLKAVNAAYEAFHNGAVEATTGASQLTNNDVNEEMEVSNE